MQTPNPHKGADLRKLNVNLLEMRDSSTAQVGVAVFCRWLSGLAALVN